MYLDDIYNVKMYLTLGAQLWEALAAGDMQRVVELYNVALSGIPYDDFSGRSEFWYRSLFLMLLRGAGVAAYAEVHTYRGCSDLVIEFENLTAVIEFKFAAKTADAAVRKTEGELQIKERDYAKFRRLEGRRVIAAVIVADDEKRQAELHSFELDR